MSQRKLMTDALGYHRSKMIKYAGAISGDNAGAEDLVQEAWLRCDRVIQEQAVEKPAHMLWRVLRNLSIDRRRRIALQRSFVVGESDESRVVDRPDEQPSVEEMLVARDELSRIQHALDGLDSRTRAAFEMHRIEGAKLREIALHLGISISSAHALVAAGVRHVRDAIDTEF